MYFDYTYLVLVLPAIILAMIASSRVHTVFRHYEHSIPAVGSPALRLPGLCWMPTDCTRYRLNISPAS